MKFKNIDLTISLIAFAIGFSDFQENMVLWLSRPVGAILLIVYFIFNLLEKESALLDEQERVKFDSFKNATEAKGSKKISKESYNPALTTASSH